MHHILTKSKYFLMILVFLLSSTTALASFECGFGKGIAFFTIMIYALLTILLLANILILIFLFQKRTLLNVIPLGIFYTITGIGMITLTLDVLSRTFFIFQALNHLGYLIPVILFIVYGIIPFFLYWKKFLDKKEVIFYYSFVIISIFLTFVIFRNWLLSIPCDGADGKGT